MKKAILILVMLLWCNVGFAKLFEIEHFKCFYDRSTSAGIDFQGSKELKVGDTKDYADSEYRWKIVISRVDHNKKTANVLFGWSERVEDLYIVNSPNNYPQQLNFIHQRNYGYTQFITIYGSKDKKANI